jgi:uncharacterized membrane protein YfcA
LNPITDPAFYAFASPAVFIMGMGKGGFGGNLAMIAMPIMALSGPTMQGAAIMFPILLVMDAISVWSWRKTWSRENVLTMLPGGLLGTILGFLTASYVSDAGIRLVLGIMSLVFLAQTFALRGRSLPPRSPDLARGTLWSSISGFTSFISHVGGPPLSIYLLPQKMPKEVFSGTLVIFFALINLIKITPLAALGVFTASNLSTSLVLAPLAALATFFGIWIVRRMPTETFYRVLYGLLLVVAIKLTWDGLRGVLG